MDMEIMKGILKRGFFVENCDCVARLVAWLETEEMAEAYVKWAEEHLGLDRLGILDGTDVFR